MEYDAMLGFGRDGAEVANQERCLWTWKALPIGRLVMNMAA
jgi:hypothetical protein